MFTNDKSSVKAGLISPTTGDKNIIKYPLTKANRLRLARAFKEVPRVDMATVLCSRLLAWCLDNGQEANWDVANRPSCTLAEKLGYLPKGGYLAHYLAAEDTT